MGFLFSKDEQELVVSTVNYSGILLSPFEFYSENYYKQEEALSKCFRLLLQESIKDFDPKTFKWKIGKIDVKVQRERYTPLYKQQVGIENNQLIDEDKFRQLWRQHFHAAQETIKFEASAQQIKTAQDFDLLCYKAIILYLYGQKDLVKVSSLDPAKYKSFMKKYFAKSFLNEAKKQEMAIKGMKESEVDVFFFQQATEQWMKTLQKSEEYVTFKSQDSSTVVLRKSRFKKIYNTHQIFELFPEHFRKELDWNEDTVFCFADNFIFISFHLSSKKEKNSLQKDKMIENLFKLSRHFPMCQIIAGGDANSFVQPQKLPANFKIFPRKKEQVTTMKKRTWLQPQFHKADELSAEVKDCLISTLNFNKERIVTLPGTDSKNVKYIPNLEHPCDHFVVTVNFILK